jgi:hypothetical protein
MKVVTFELQPDPAMNSSHRQLQSNDGGTARRNPVKCRIA